MIRADLFDNDFTYVKPPLNINKFVNYLPLDDYNAIMNEYNYMFKRLKAIGSGSFATVYEYKDYAIKFYTDDECDDGEILEELGNSKWFPKLYFYNKDFMVVEKIEGITVEKLIYNSDEYIDYCFEPLCNSIVDNILNPLLNEKRYYANDIHNENLMVTKDGRLVIVDVGLFSKFSHPMANPDSECDTIKLYMENINNQAMRNKVKYNSKQPIQGNDIELTFNDGRVYELKNIIIKAELQL